MLGNAQRALQEGRRDTMSTALWCDQGGHAFSERDPGRQRISVATLDPETDRETQITKDFRGQCATAAGLNARRVTRPPALDGPDHG
jgi:hypothetical protein